MSLQRQSCPDGRDDRLQLVAAEHPYLGLDVEHLPQSADAQRRSRPVWPCRRHCLPDDEDLALCRILLRAVGELAGKATRSAPDLFARPGGDAPEGRVDDLVR